MSSLSKFINEVNSDISVVKDKFIYYKEDTGEILKISNKKEDTEYSVLEVDRELVSDIFNGDKSLSNFRIEYDLTLKCKSLVEIGKVIDVLSLSENFFKIPKNIESISDLTIVQDFRNHEWIIKINKSLLNMLHIKPFNHKQILFSVTSVNDPNIVYRTIVINLYDLLKKKSLYHAFQYEAEEQLDKVSIYTLKYFNTYKHEVIYE